MPKGIHKLSIGASVLVAAVISGSSVLALPPQATAHAQTSTDSSSRSTNNTKSEAGQTTAQTKLTEAKLRSCQNRQQAIQNIMTRISDRGQKQLTLFEGIATKVETFYTNKGKTLSNYDTLAADVNAKQAAAQTAVDNIKSASTGFSCDGTDPIGFVNSFKSSLKSEISALQDYRTSVKNLIVGVKSVEGTTSSSSSTGGSQ